VSSTNESLIFRKPAAIGYAAFQGTYYCLWEFRVFISKRLRIALDYPFGLGLPVPKIPEMLYLIRRGILRLLGR